MNEPLPRRWSRRMRLIYITATAFGGIVLMVFLLLMWLLYWMKAPFDIPDAGRLIHPEATAYVVVDVGPGSHVRLLPDGFANALTLGAPEQARNLILKGLNDKKCRVQVVASVVPGVETSEVTLATSLGRYPALFRVVRKDLKRRFESGTLKASVSHHNENEVFVGSKDAGRLNVLSLLECTMIRGSSQAIVEEAIDRLGSGNDASPNWPAPFVMIAGTEDEISAVHISGWLKEWQQVLLSVAVAGEEKADLEGFMARLAEAVPGVTRISDMRFEGQLEPGLTTLHVSFQALGEGDPESMAESLQGWIRDNGQALGIQVSDVVLREGRMEFDLDLRSKEE